MTIYAFTGSLGWLESRLGKWIPSKNHIVWNNGYECSLEGNHQVDLIAATVPALHAMYGYTGIDTARKTACKTTEPVLSQSKSLPNSACKHSPGFVGRAARKTQSSNVLQKRRSSYLENAVTAEHSTPGSFKLRACFSISLLCSLEYCPVTEADTQCHNPGSSSYIL